MLRSPKIDSVTTCSIDGCDAVTFCRGWCGKHYKRWQLFGTTDLPQRAPRPERKCSVDGCERRHDSRGFCGFHVRRFKKYGDPLGGPPNRLDLEGRIQASVQRGDPDECWPWMGTRDKNGYGITSRKRIRVHRWMFEQHNGPIGPGLVICHRCDNPPCCNPAHLWVGTPEENNADKVAKNRCGNPGRGSDNHQSRLSEDSVREIRRLHAAGSTMQTLADEFGVGITTIWYIVHRVTWNHV